MVADNRQARALDFAKQFNELCTQAKLTHRVVARKTGISIDTVNSWTRGAKLWKGDYIPSIPRQDHFQAIADLLFESLKNNGVESQDATAKVRKLSEIAERSWQPTEKDVSKELSAEVLLSGEDVSEEVLSVAREPELSITPKFLIVLTLLLIGLMLILGVLVTGVQRGILASTISFLLVLMLEYLGSRLINHYIRSTAEKALWSMRNNSDFDDKRTKWFWFLSILMLIPPSLVFNIAISLSSQLFFWQEWLLILLWSGTLLGMGTFRFLRGFLIGNTRFNPVISSTLLVIGSLLVPLLVKP